MNPLQMWVVVAAPFVAVLFGILLNQKGIERLDKRLDRVEDGLQTGLRGVNARIDDLNKTVHNDVQGLLGMISDHGQRIVRLEERH